MIKPPLNHSDTSPIQGWEFPLGNGQKYLEVVAWEELGGGGREGKWSGEEGGDVDEVDGVDRGEVEEEGSGSELAITGIILEKGI